MILMKQGMEISMAASPSASHDSVVMIPNKFHSPKMFLLLKCSFGSKDEIIHLSKSDVKNMTGYIAVFCTDAAFCNICMKAEWEKYKASIKREPALSLRLKDSTTQ